MIQGSLLPPLRLIVNTTCNGSCYFCHKEGSIGNGTMEYSVIDDAIKAALALRIKRITLTGGEPTLREDLSEVIGFIKEIYPASTLGLTTNGLKLAKVLSLSAHKIDKLSVSIISLNKATYLKFTKTEPIELLEAIAEHPHLDKTVNIVVVESNINELDAIIKMCFSFGMTVDIMFELFANDISMQRLVINQLIDTYGLYHLSMSSTPAMIIYTNTKNTLRVKSPFISKLLRRKICLDCEHYHQCGEQVCAVRVYPSGIVSSCLNKHIQSNKESVYDKVIDVYKIIDTKTEATLDFLYPSP